MKNTFKKYFKKCYSKERIFTPTPNVIQFFIAYQTNKVSIELFECVWYCGSGCGCGLKKVVL